MAGTLFVRESGGLQSWITYAAICLAVFLGGYLVYGTWTRDNQPLDYPWICMTEGCGHTEHRVPTLDDPAPPLPCPKCGKNSLVPPRVCPNCKEFVVLNQWRGLPPPTKCPKCGQEVRVESY
jgi:hypothetical protein